MNRLIRQLKRRRKKRKKRREKTCQLFGWFGRRKEGGKEGAASTELPADSAGLVQRRLTPMTSMLMHRTIES